LLTLNPPHSAPSSPPHKRWGTRALKPALLSLLTLSATLAAQSFSHAEALRTVKSCQPCHAPIPKSTAISKREARPVHWVKFSHATHVQLPGIAQELMKAIDTKKYLGIVAPDLRQALESKNVCQACHRGMSEVTGALAKANYPAMADCLVCHNRIDPPFSCAQCHGEDAKTLQPASHVAGFIDLHTNKNSGLEKATCAGCHGRRFTCMGCH